MRWPRFTILQLFLVTALVGLLAGWWTQSRRASLRSTLRGVELSPDGKRLAAFYELGNIEVWDVSGEQAKLIRSRLRGQNWIFGLRFVEKDTVVVHQLSHRSPQLIAWNIVTGKERVVVRLPGFGFYDVSRDGMVAATISTPSTTPAVPAIDLWDLKSGKRTRQIETGITGRVREVLISDDGRFIAAYVISGAGWGEIHVFNARNGQCVVSLTNASPFHGSTLSGDGHKLALAGRREYSIRIFDLTEPSLEPVAVIETMPPSFQLSRDGSRLMAIDEGTVTIWDVKSKRRLWTEKLNSEVFYDLERLFGSPRLMSADDRRIAVPAQGGEIQILDSATGQRLMTIGGTHPLRDTLLYSTALLGWAVAWGLVSRREKLRQPAARPAAASLPIRFYTLSARRAVFVLALILGALCALAAWLLQPLVADVLNTRPGLGLFAVLFAAIFGLVCGVLYLRMRFFPLWASLRNLRSIVGKSGRRQRQGRITGLFAGQSTIEHSYLEHIEEIRQKLTTLLGRDVQHRNQLLVIGLQRSDDYFLLNRTRLSHGGIVMTHLFADECRVCEELAHRDGTTATVMLRATIALALLRRHWRLDAPPWLTSTLSVYLAADETWPASLGRAQRMLIGILGDDALPACHEFLSMTVKDRYQQVFEKDDPAILRKLTLNQAIAVLLGEYLLGSRPDSPRDKLLEVIRGVGKGNLDVAVERVFGHAAVGLIDPWWAWVRRQPFIPWEPPPAEARVAINRLARSIGPTSSLPLREQQRVVTVLGSSGDLTVAPTLLAILETPHHPLRAEALWALRGISGQQWDDEPPRWRGWWQEVEPQASLASASVAGTDPARQVPSPWHDEPVNGQLAAAIQEAESPSAQQPHEPWQLSLARTLLGAGGVWGIVFTVAVSFYSGTLLMLPTLGIGLLIGLLATARAAGRHWWGLRTAAGLQIAAIVGCDPVQSLLGIAAAKVLRGKDVRRYLQRIGGN